MEYPVPPPGDTSIIDSIPVEILDIIFEYTAAAEGLHPDFDTPLPDLPGGAKGYKLSLFPYNISAVCKSWRSVILYRPLYWRQVVIDLAEDPAPFLPVIAKFHTGHETKAVVIFSSNKDIDKNDEKRRARNVFKEVESIISLCAAITFDLVYQSSLPSVAEVLAPYIPVLKIVRLTCEVHDCDPEYPDYEVQSNEIESESDPTSDSSVYTISDMDVDEQPPVTDAATVSDNDEHSGSESDASQGGDVDQHHPVSSPGDGSGEAEQVDDDNEEDEGEENIEGEDGDMEVETDEDEDSGGEADDDGDNGGDDDGDDNGSSDGLHSEASSSTEYLAITELTITGVGLNQLYGLGDNWLHTSFQVGRDITISIIHFKVGPYGSNIFRRTGPIISLSQFHIFLSSLRYKLVFTDISLDSSKKDTSLDDVSDEDGYLPEDAIIFPQLTFCNCTPEFISAFFSKFWTYEIRYAIHCPIITFDGCVIPRMPGPSVAVPSDGFDTPISNFELRLRNIRYTPDPSGQFNESVYNAFRAFPAAGFRVENCHGLNHHCLMQLTLPVGKEQPKLQFLQIHNSSGFTSATIRDLVQYHRFLSAGPDRAGIVPLRVVRIGGTGPLLNEEDMLWFKESDNVGSIKVIWAVNRPPFNPLFGPRQVNWRIMDTR